MDADGSIVYRWNHTFRIQMETDKAEPPVYADTRIPYTGFLCVCVYAQTYANTVEMAERRYHIRVVQGYTGLSRVYTGFIQGYTRVISQTRVTTFNEGNEGYGDPSCGGAEPFGKSRWRDRVPFSGHFDGSIFT